jgi:hypothetical protein
MLDHLRVTCIKAHPSSLNPTLIAGTAVAALAVDAGTRNLSFSFSPACTDENMHSQEVDNIQEAVDLAIKWLSSPDFAWTAYTNYQ